MAHDDVNQASQRRVPVLLMHGEESRPPARPDPVAAELQALASRYLARPAAPKAPASPGAPSRPRSRAPEVTRYLDAQLETLVRMQGDLSGAGYRENFRYIAYRSLHLMQSRGPREFGDTRLLKERWRHRASDRTAGRASE